MEFVKFSSNLSFLYLFCTYESDHSKKTLYFLYFQIVRVKMNTCHVCKVVSKYPLRSCVCRKVSYCSKECQAKDWKVHKPSCPPFVLRESPGKGRGLFATRRIKAGEVILEEYPLLTRDGLSLILYGAMDYDNIDEDTKTKILQLHDPAETLKTLRPKTVQEMIRKNFWKLCWC